MPLFVSACSRESWKTYFQRRRSGRGPTGNIIEMGCEEVTLFIFSLEIFGRQLGLRLRSYADVS